MFNSIKSIKKKLSNIQKELDNLVTKKRGEATLAKELAALSLTAANQLEQEAKEAAALSATIQPTL